MPSKMTQMYAFYKTLGLHKIRELTVFVLLLIILALWNMPHTIAGRYTCEGLLLLIIVFGWLEIKPIFKSYKFLFVFFIYLFIQLAFYSTNYTEAFSNFKAEWLHFILFTIIGAGSGYFIGSRSSPRLLLYLALAFSFPLLIHLALSVLRGVTIGAIPWRYWGINEIHGDFGYPAMQATIFITTFYLYQAKLKSEKILAIALVVVCIASPLLAQSRGGTGFAVAATLFVYMTYIFIGEFKNSSVKILIQFLTLIFLAFATYNVALISNHERWSGVGSRILSGLQGSPIEIQCKGIEYVRNELVRKGVDITQILENDFESIANGEGLRMSAARAGLDLIISNPMGINQSRQGYEIALSKECQGTPKIFVAHAHNGWIDTALAIGIFGAVFLLLILLIYSKLGYTALKNGGAISPFGMALFSSGVLWIIRGLFDSTFRDQMLEMQAFTFAFLWSIIITKSKVTSKNVLTDVKKSSIPIKS